MGLKSLIDRLGGEATTDEDTPSHVCHSCGETYYVDPAEDIKQCRGCGSTRVEAT